MVIALETGSVIAPSRGIFLTSKDAAAIILFSKERGKLNRGGQFICCTEAKTSFISVLFIQHGVAAFLLNFTYMRDSIVSFPLDIICSTLKTSWMFLFKYNA